VNLKQDKVLVAETADDLDQPGLHCTIIDMGSAMRTRKQFQCLPLFIQGYVVTIKAIQCVNEVKYVQ
jgi:hypothetical protein